MTLYEVGKIYHSINTNPETGEIIEVVPWIKRRELEFYENKAVQYAERADKRSFFNVKLEAWTQLRGIQNRTLGYAIVLSSYMHYDNVIFPQKHSKVPISEEELYSLLEISSSTSRRVLNDLKQHGLLESVVITVKGKEYSAMKMSEEFFYRGKHSENGEEKTIKTFNDTIQELYFEHGASGVAFIAKLLPYIDKISNLIVRNPFRNPNIEPPINLRVVDIAEVTNLSVKQTSKHLRELKYEDISAFSRIRAGNNVMFRLNPEIATKVAGITSEAVLAEFISQENREEDFAV